MNSDAAPALKYLEDSSIKMEFDRYNSSGMGVQGGSCSSRLQSWCLGTQIEQEPKRPLLEQLLQGCPLCRAASLRAHHPVPRKRRRSRAAATRRRRGGSERLGRADLGFSVAGFLTSTDYPKDAIWKERRELKRQDVSEMEDEVRRLGNSI